MRAEASFYRIKRPQIVAEILWDTYYREIALEFQPSNLVYGTLRKYRREVFDRIVRISGDTAEQIDRILEKLQERGEEDLDRYRSSLSQEVKKPPLSADSQQFSLLRGDVHKLAREEERGNWTLCCPLSREIHFAIAIALADYDVQPNVFDMILVPFQTRILQEQAPQDDWAANVQRRGQYIENLKTRFFCNGNDTAVPVAKSGNRSADTLSKGVIEMPTPTPAPPFDGGESEPAFGDDFFWWLETHGDDPPEECRGKFVLIFNQQILETSDHEDQLIAAAEKRGLRGRHYVIIAVDVMPERQPLEIPFL